MNVAFFLTPKHHVVWLPQNATLAAALQHMEPHRHSAVPLLDDAGRYTGTLTEGDVLVHLRHSDGSWPEVLATTRVCDIPRWMKNDPIHIEADIETLVDRAVAQSFVPVVDDRGVFVGMVLRKAIIQYLAKRSGLPVAA